MCIEWPVNARQEDDLKVCSLICLTFWHAVVLPFGEAQDQFALAEVRRLKHHDEDLVQALAYAFLAA